MVPGGGGHGEGGGGQCLLPKAGVGDGGPVPKISSPVGMAASSSSVEDGRK